MLRGFLERMRWRLISFMQGRYGQDELSKHLYVLALVLLVLSWFWPVPFYFLSLFCLFISIYRSFSKNFVRRQNELYKYRSFYGKISGKFSVLKMRFNDRKTHKYFKCKCGAMLRVPKGKGTIDIGCPKCKARMTKRT